MKSMIDESGTDIGTDGTKRGLFRRAKRVADASGQSQMSPNASSNNAVALVDDLARRIDELAAGGSDSRADAETSVRAALELQRAAIARANDAASTTAATQSTPPQTVSMPEAIVHETNNIPAPAPAPEPQSLLVDDIEARMDAVLAPAPVAAALALPTEQPAAEMRATQPAQAHAPVPAPSPTPAGPLVSAAPTASAVLGIDVERMVRLIEEEAVATRQRIELEVRSAHAQSTEILDRAESEAERIREHGQAQARVLLGEVEEIISEAQQTGEQILIRANDEASSLRGDATGVLQQAQTEARAIVETARREGEQVLAEQRRLATVRAQEAMREQDRLKDQIRRLEERRRQVLESLEPLISQLTQMMPVGVTEPNVVHLDRTRG